MEALFIFSAKIIIIQYIKRLLINAPNAEMKMETEGGHTYNKLLINNSFELCGIPNIIVMKLGSSNNSNRVVSIQLPLLFVCSSPLLSLHPILPSPEDDACQ